MLKALYKWLGTGGATGGHFPNLLDNTKLVNIWTLDSWSIWLYVSLAELTNAVFLHQRDEISFCQQLGWAGLSIYHLHCGGLKASILLIYRDNLLGGGGDR